MRTRLVHLLLGSVISGLGYSAQPEVRWTMINVNSSEAQADAHLIQFPSGENQLIDAGDNESQLVPYLRLRGVSHLSKVIISHPHKDHYSGLRALLAAGIRIGSVYMNIPDKRLCDSEIPWGCDYQDVVGVIELLKKSGVPVRAVEPSVVFYNDKTITLESLYAFNPETLPSKNVNINDLSAIMLLSVGKVRALFTGDLNSPLGEYLAVHGRRLEAEILKVPHHGAEGLAPNAFFDRVNPKVAVVPAPRGLWYGERARRVREYVKRKGVRTFVNGLDGHVTVCLGSASVRVLVGTSDCSSSASTLFFKIASR